MKFYTTSRLSENMHKTPEGFLVCVGVPIARTGEQVYGPGETPLAVGDDGMVTVTREAREVFRPETMASFVGKAITIYHPETDGNDGNKFDVNPENHEEHGKGHLQNIRRGTGEHADDLIADLFVTAVDAIDAIEAGLREVSCGYSCRYVETGPGRGRQIDIIGNHLALVEAGRAGSLYAIKDHRHPGAKGKAKMKRWDRIKAIFAKAQDEAMELAGEDGDDDEEEVTPKVAKSSETKKLLKAVRALDAKVTALAAAPAAPAKKTKDATTAATGNQPAKTVVDDDTPAPGAAPTMTVEERMAALEAKVDALLASLSDEGDDDTTDADADPDADPDGEEDDGDTAYDEEAEESDEVTDSMPESTCDTAARVEILAPGMKADQKDVKTKALKAAWRTKDGKKVLARFTGGKIPNFKDEKAVNALFVASSELLKVTRTQDLARTKTQDDFPSYAEQPENGMSAEDMNKKNAEFYASKK